MSWLAFGVERWESAREWLLSTPSLFFVFFPADTRFDRFADFGAVPLEPKTSVKASSDPPAF